MKCVHRCIILLQETELSLWDHVSDSLEMAPFNRMHTTSY